MYLASKQGKITDTSVKQKNKDPEGLTEAGKTHFLFVPKFSYFGNLTQMTHWSNHYQYLMIQSASGLGYFFQMNVCASIFMHMTMEMLYVLAKNCLINSLSKGSRRHLKWNLSWRVCKYCNQAQPIYCQITNPIQRLSHHVWFSASGLCQQKVNHRSEKLDVISQT